MMKQWSLEIYNYIQQYVAHSPILWIYLASLLFLCFRGKEKRCMLVYPSIVIMVVILNPISYGYVWIKLITYAFWRMLWMIPVIPVIACAVLELAGLVKKDWFAPLVTVCFVLAMLVTGDNIYKQEGVFTKQHNLYKLQDSDVAVAEALLELSDEPVAVVCPYLYCRVRQYSGKIKLIFGREANNYILPISDPEIMELSYMTLVNSGDTSRYVELAEKCGAEFIVLPQDHGFVLMGDYKYQWVAQVDRYYIYQYVGE